MNHLPKLGLGLLLLLYLAMTLLISRVTPFNKGPDEETNVDYAVFITATGRLPLTYAEREQVGKDSNWPALYHVAVAGVANLLDADVSGPPVIKIFWDSFRYRAIDYGAEWYYLRTEDQLPPYAGRILVLQIGRWLSIVCGLITLLLVYRVIDELLPERPWLALAGTALLAFLPIYTFMSGVMNEDTMMAALTTLYLWLLILIVKRPDRSWLYWALGLALGVSVTVKYTTIILPLEVVVVLAVLARRHHLGWGWWLRRVTVVGLASIIASSWWFGWNFWYLNEVEELGWVAGLLRPIFTGGPDVTLARLGYYFSGGEIGLEALPAGRQDETFSRWISQTFLSFFGVSIGGAVPLAPWSYLLVGLVLAGAGYGLWRLWRTDRAARLWLGLLGFHVAIFFILPLLRFGLSRRIGETAQGRHILLPAAAAVSLLLVWGLVNATPRRGRGWFFAALLACLIGWSSLHIYRLATFEPPPVPLRTDTEAAAWLAQPVKARFGEAIELAGYELTPRPDQGQLALKLAWQSLAAVDESYLLEVRVADATGTTVSHWLGYNGQGRLPTLTWGPGDVIFDRLSLPWPNLPPGDYTVQVQLLGRAGSLGEPLTLATFSTTTAGNLPLPHRLELANQAPLDFALWRADGPVEAGLKPVYRYPATIGVVAATTEPVELVDASGQAWPAERSQAGLHSFVIGPRWPSGDYRLQVGAATSTPLLTVENWWERQFEPPPIETPLAANFADQIRLLGYKLPAGPVKAGDAFPITLYWQAPPERAPQAGFIQFNHLLDVGGTLRGGYDRQPLEYYNTLLWAPGEVVVDGYSVPVAPDAPPGDYYLNVGYYLTVGESAVNLPLVIDGQLSETTSVAIGPIQVVAP